MLVEDDGLDVMDFRRTLEKMNIWCRLVVAKNGEEALRMLSGEGPDHLETRPDLVLIDINMPKMNGLELLGHLRKSEEWKNLKCFIITTSEEEVDKTAARELGVSGYIVKPFKRSNTASIDSFNLMIDLMNIKGSY